MPILKRQEPGRTIVISYSSNVISVQILNIKKQKMISFKNKKYEPYHHKYRPQKISELVGQDAIAQTLSNAIDSEKIMPAYLFTGPRGTGKTSSARILAKSLNCLLSDRPTKNPCGVCEVCREIEKSSSLDVIEIDAASNTGVENIRDLIEKAQFSPAICRFKVYIVDECHMLSNAAFNSLLKTLEEPPNQVIFVLATTDPQKVLPTVISRCQRFDFKRIALPDMVKHLAYISKEEGLNIAEESLYAIAQIAQGGLRDAESLLDQISLLDTKDNSIEVNQVWDLAGYVPEKDLLGMAKYLFDFKNSNNPSELIEIIRRTLDKGKEPLVILQSMTSLCRDMLIAKTAPDKYELSKLTKSGWVELCAIASNIDIEEILKKQKFLQESEYQIKTTTQPVLWLEVTLLNLLDIKTTKKEDDYQPIKEVIKEVIKESPKETIKLSPLQRWDLLLSKIESVPVREIFKKQSEMVTYQESEGCVTIKLKASNRVFVPLLLEKIDTIKRVSDKAIKIEISQEISQEIDPPEVVIKDVSQKIANLFEGEILSLEPVPNKYLAEFVPLERPSVF